MDKALTPPWAKGLMYCELFFQLPFFFYATASLLSKNEGLRIPGIIYGSHTATTLIPILMYIWCFPEDVSPFLTQSDKIVLFLFYLPYLLIPLLFMIICVFNDTLFGEGGGIDRIGRQHATIKAKLY